MKIRQLRIQNFRGIKDLELDIGDTTVLIGENNSGKTAILEALRLCLRDLGPRRRIVFDEFDFHLKNEGADPSSSDPIAITITFAESSPNEWDQRLLGVLNRNRILQVDPTTSLGLVRLRVDCSYDLTTRDLSQGYSFLNITGAPLTGVGDAALSALQHEVPYFYLAALRDAARHFDAKGQFWRPFLKDSQLPAAKRAEIETKLKAINDLVVSSHTSFDQARTKLRNVQNVVPMAAGDIVSIEAVPSRIFDMLSRAQIHLGTSTGAKVPIGRHGEGTQSLAVLMLFSAFLDAWPQGAPVVALEEPEAHLHPSAVRALWSTVAGIAGQKIVSTHSGDLLSEIPIDNVRRLAKTSSGIKSFRLLSTTLSAEDKRKFDYHIRYARGELLFARCWILVEGETEMTLLPEIARHLRINLEQLGIRCIPHRNASIELFLKVARDLGIRWCVLADNDQQGASDQRHTTSYSTAAGLSNNLHVMSEPDIEGHLCASGFGPIYEAHLSMQTRRQVTASPGTPNYFPEVIKAIKGSISKPAVALEVVQAIKGGSPVPPLLESTIRSAVTIAGAI